MHARLVSAAFAVVTTLVPTVASNPVANTIDARDTEWADFWSENLCEIHSGGDSYDIANTGLFQNGGRHFNCRTNTEFTLISYASGDFGGTIPKYCKVITDCGICENLEDLGFTPGDGGYYRFSLDKVCPAYEDPDPDEQTESEEALDKRNSNYLAFYADPDCIQQSGSARYSTDNAGCFQNGGAYVAFGGDDSDWHLEQWTGTDNYQCAIEMQACAVAPGVANEDACIHVDSLEGFTSGYGSYKINRAGCP
ncbi:hypothetical protein LTR56_027402 [Elasticomyces elasticus]|nr:hypothetical protein LTR56_027402 [Elasticomyces elasticus]KAK3614352.1 hypothetical protein LTR22_027815 [Elasticomyces elasticus]